MENTQSQYLKKALRFIEGQYTHYINGEMIQKKEGEGIAIINPDNESILTTLFQGNIEELNQAVESAHTAFEKWSEFLPAQRQNLLNAFAEKLLENKEILANIESLCTGKNINIARFEIDQSIDFTRYYAGWATKISGETQTPSLPSFAGESYTAVTVREPIGVVGAIIPWNFPVMIAIWKVAAALACGCTVVVKPSEFTPFSALIVAKLAVEAGIPPGVLNVINGSGRLLGNELIQHPLIRKISFTGSVPTGTQIGINALKADLTRFTLELGGKNPAVFCEDMDPQAVVDAIIQGGLSHQGQICASIERAYIHHSIIDEVITLFPESLKNIKIGEPLDPTAQFGPLSNKAHYEKILEFFEEAKNDEYEIVYGANKVGSNGYYVEPTIIRSYKHDSLLMTEETFGPLITLYGYQDENELRQIINNTPFGLTGSVWTDNLSRALRLTKMIKAGTVWINMHLALDPSISFGGVKASGSGREFGSSFIDDYTDLKSILIRY